MTPLTISVPQNGFKNEETHHRRPYCDRTARTRSYTVIKPIRVVQAVGALSPLKSAVHERSSSPIGAPQVPPFPIQSEMAGQEPAPIQLSLGLGGGTRHLGIGVRRSPFDTAKSLEW